MYQSLCRRLWRGLACRHVATGGSSWPGCLLLGWSTQWGWRGLALSVEGCPLTGCTPQSWCPVISTISRGGFDIRNSMGKCTNHILNMCYQERLMTQKYQSRLTYWLENFHTFKSFERNISTCHYFSWNASNVDYYKKQNKLLTNQMWF